MATCSYRSFSIQFEKKVKPNFEKIGILMVTFPGKMFASFLPKYAPCAVYMILGQNLKL